MIHNLDNGHIHSRAADFIDSCLAEGKTLASLARESVDLSTGTLTSVVPKEYVGNQVGEFDRGHLLGEEIDVKTSRQISLVSSAPMSIRTRPGSDRELAQILSKRLEGDDSCCMLENYLASPGDPWLRRAKSRIVIYASEVYHLLTHADLDKDSVRQAIRESESIPIFIGGVGTVAERLSCLTSGASISGDDLRTFANSLSFLFVLAYDGEGYLCWQKE
jgi:hypothetical protein